MKSSRIIILLIVIFIIMAKEIKAMPESMTEATLRSNSNIEYKAGNLRDPFQSPQKQKEPEKQMAERQMPERPLPTLTIQGIVWGGKFPQAIINNKVVKIGDTVNEVQIVDINKSGVTVSFENREYNLPSTTALLENSKERLKGGKNEE